MSSFDNKFGLYGSNGSHGGSHNDHPGTSYGSRPSNTLARIAFNLYGNSTPQSVNSSNSSISPSTRSSIRPFSQIHASPSISSNEATYNDINQFRFKAGYEMTSFSILNNDSYDQAVIAGKNTLQVLNFSQNKVTEDLLQGSLSMKNKKVIGSILDVSAGYQTFNKFVATSTTTGSILIFNHQAPKPNRLSYKLSDHTRAVNSVSFSQLDPHLLLSGSQDGAMKLWDLRSSSVKPTITMFGNSDAVRSLKFSPFHNKKFAAIFDSGVIQKWDIRNINQFEKKFNAHTGPGLTLDWHPDFDYVVSGGRDKQIQVWNMNSNDQRQIPDHVIHTASPISKVSFRPVQSSNINSAEIATSFLTNDLGVQIYSLKRKYIPVYHIESHSMQVTGLNFLNGRYLLTCSKDKYFIVDDLANYPPIIDNLSVASTSWAPTDELMFTNQSLENSEITEQYEPAVAGAAGQSNSASFSTSPTSNANLTMTGTSISSVAESTSPRPGLSRASSQFVRPQLTRNHSHGSGQQSTNVLPTSNFHRNSSFAQQLQNPSVINPIVIPVNLPINRTPETLKYLVENYRFDSNENLIETCVINSDIAASVGNLRDAQTWKVISESLVWESKLETELVYRVNQERQNIDNESLRSMDTSDHQVDSEKYNYSTSNSTNYGKSPSLSDLSEFNNSINSRNNHPSFSSYKMSNLKQSILKGESNELILEESEDESLKKTITKDDVLKWSTEPKKRATSMSGIDPRDEDALDFTDDKAIPILKPRSKRSSMRLITDVSPSGARSISPAFSMTSTMSNTSQMLLKPMANRPLPLTKSVRPQQSMMSELTKQLTNQKLDDEEEAESSVLLPPFAPKFILEKVINWNLEQGDLIMSTVLIILFNSKYKIYPDHSNLMKEVVYGFLQWLQRMRFFVKFSELNQILVRDGFELEISSTSVNSSGLRHFCSSCGKLIVNEASKAKLHDILNKKARKQESDEPEEKFNKFVGTWFCESCSAWNRCVYCNEVVKGLCSIRLKCGHNGHFGCLKTWFLEDGYDDCPGGCISG